MITIIILVRNPSPGGHPSDPTSLHHLAAQPKCPDAPSVLIAQGLIGLDALYPLMSHAWGPLERLHPQNTQAPYELAKIAAKTRQNARFEPAKTRVLKLDRSRRGKFRRGKIRRQLRRGRLAAFKLHTDEL